MGTGNTSRPTYHPPGYHDMLSDAILGAPPSFLGHRPHDYNYGLLNHAPSSQVDTHPTYRLSWPSNEFLLSFGGNVNSAGTFGPNDIFTHRVAGLEFGDPGGLPRYDIDPGGPIHLITNVRTDSSQVSSLYLSEEVCRYSVRKAHWY